MNQGRILLARHGQVTQAEPRRFLGQRDLSLTREVRKQAEALGRFLASTPLIRVVCSDLHRTRETAGIALRGRNFEIQEQPSLRELNLGQWEGLTREEVQARFPETYEQRGHNLAATRPEGGESFQDLLLRARPFFQSLLAGPPGDILVVAHSGVNRVLLCDLLGMPLQNLFRIGQDYCCLNIIARQVSPLLERLNMVPWCSTQGS